MAQIGDVVAGRFVLMAQAGHGGMGAVFKAHDRLCDTTVAIKLMYDPGEVEIQRFLREATVLESFNHEHIVAHRSHGVSEWGEPWLAMEWLEGEDLATRLHRGRLSVEDSLQVIRGAALALDAAHSRGIVHRDIKPSNLYLVEGKPEAVKIVDFGIAAATMGTSRLTATSIILGTPGYMAPEQARGDAGVGPPADIFSLGCVLYECLAGKPAFVGAHLIALLAKVLLADPPKLSDERPNVPQLVLQLCDQMMAKSPEERFPNGGALIDILNRLTTSPNTSAAVTRQPSATTQMGVYERQLVSSIVIAPQQNNPALQSSGPSTVPDETLKSIRQIVETPGTSLHVLADGSSVVVFTLPSNPVDQAANAALCAFRLRDIVEGRPIVLVTGHRDSTLRSPVGEIMDRAGDLLSRIPLGETRVGVDDDTRALLEGRFDIGSANGVYFLQSLGAVDESRFLLGKATPFVGREREFTRLLEIVEEGFDERRAQAILVIGAAGMGKSRLRQEFLRRLQQRHSGLVLEVGRADILGNSGAFSLIAGMFRQALGIHLGDPIAEQQDKIAHIINLVLKGDDAQRVTEFICELIGAPFPDERSLRLRAARQDAQIMASQIEAAYVDLMRASVQNYPIVLVLEDLHWADAASFKLLNAALRELANEPLIIMAFARPEVKTRFPRLWQSRQLYEIVLNPLSRKSAIELARNVLGDDFDAKRIGAIVDHAAGNAFFLEELLRAAALGGDDKLPPTVLGMVEARIGLLDALARRVLRAASIFGSSFWVNGVKTLLGEGADALDDILQELLEQEFIQPAKTQRFAEESEYVFRHALFREGAYAMLTAQDRQTGHALAGVWLENAHESDLFIIATHFELGGDRQRAAHWYVHAAERALQGNDLATAFSALERTLTIDPDGPLSAKAWSLRANGAMWGGDYRLALSAGVEAMRRTRPGSVDHSKAIFGLFPAAMLLRQQDHIQHCLELLGRIEPDDNARSYFASALATSVVMFCFAGRKESVEFYVGRMQDLARHDPIHDPATTAWAQFGKACWHRYVERNHFAALRLDRLAEQYFDSIGDRQHAASSGLDASLLGAFDEADEQFNQAQKKRGRGTTALIIQYNWAFSQLERGNAAQSITLAQKMLEECRTQGEFVIAATARLILSEALIDLGKLDEAAETLSDLDTQLAVMFVNHTHALGVRAKLLLACGRNEEAVRLAKDTISRARTAGVYDLRHQALILTHAEALAACNDMEAARHAIAEARNDIMTRAAQIDDANYRASFLERVATNARILQLATNLFAEVEPK